MKNAKNKTATLIALFLMFAMAFSIVALPFVNAQELIMNLPGADGVMHYILLNDTGYDIDLNGPSSPIANVTLWVRYPGRSAFTYIGGFPTTSSGDLDIYTGQSPPTPPFMFNETGLFELKWALPPTFTVESNVEQVTVVSDSSQIPPQVSSNTQFIYAGASPSTIGVGQNVLLVCFTQDYPPDIGEQAGLIPGQPRQNWMGVTLEVTKPDGTIEVISLGQSDPIGANYVTFVPTETGQYYVQAKFPGIWKNDTRGVPQQHTFYTQCESALVPFFVQQEQVPLFPESPLPSGYWSRPVSSASREWYPLLSGWMEGNQERYPLGSYGGGSTSNYAYGLGCETPHVLWTRPHWAGGLMDSAFLSTGFATEHYQGTDFNPLILNGKLYYQYQYVGHASQGYVVVDLYTGELLYQSAPDESMPQWASIYNYESPNQHGGYPYLWKTVSRSDLPDRLECSHAVQTAAGLIPTRVRSSTMEDLSNIVTGTIWEMLDGQTMNHVAYIGNVSSGGSGTYSADGSLLRYSTATYGGQYYLRIWNSSAGTMVISEQGTGNWQFRPMGGGFGGSNPFFGGLDYDIIHDGNLFWSLNVSIPNVAGYSISSIREGEYIIFADTGVNNAGSQVETKLMCLSLETGQEGTLLWQSSHMPPFAGDGVSISMTAVYPDEGVVCYENNEELERYGFDMRTGAKLWQSDPAIKGLIQFGYYGQSETYYQGFVYSYGYHGHIIAYNVTTGVIEWMYNCTTVGFESPYGGMYPLAVNMVSDGKLYLTGSEHSPTQPLWRGPNLRCINATTGEEIFKTLFYGAGMSPTSSLIAMADGRLIGNNYHDMSVYCFGKGNSKTTVSAAPEISVHGNGVMLKGTVVDMTPTGRRNINDVLEFTLEGTPAISDEDMAAWMEYLFQEQGFPANAKGVEVTLDAIDPNSNFVNIGTVTSDVTGNFALAFTPEVPGTYQIIATFAGSKAYGSSFGTTYIDVMEAPEATPPPTPPPAPMTDTYVLGIGAGAIIAIIAVGLILILMMRKR